MLKKKYNMASHEKNVSEKALKHKIVELEKVALETAEHAKEIISLEAEVNKISMTNKKQETTV